MSYYSIVYNGLNLNDDVYVTGDLDDSAPFEQMVSLFNLARANGAKVTNDQVGTKPIRITGKIHGTSMADIDQKIDALNLAFNGHDKFLDIDYAGTTRRYICTPAQRPIIPRPVRAASWANFELNLIATQFAYETSTTVLATGNITTDNAYSLDIGGNAPDQYPVISITLTTIVSGTSNTISLMKPSTGERMVITHKFTQGDVILIDPRPDIQSVTINNVIVDFDGPFIAFEPGDDQILVVTADFNLSVHTDTITASGSWVAPVGKFEAHVEAVGGGGAGGRKSSVSGGAGGGAGGSYAAADVIITPGVSYPVVVGAGGTSTTSLSNPGGSSTFNGTDVVAEGGDFGGGNASPIGATGSIANSVGTIKYPGGNGGNGGGGGTPGGGGGEGASASGVGNNGANGTSGGAGGTGTAGGDGGAGRNTTAGAGNPGSAVGGAGGGALYSGSAFAGGAGARGEVKVSYDVPSFTFAVTIEQVKLFV